MSEFAVTDTHALIWYALERWNRLGRRARALFERADRGEAAIYLPALALVEVLEAEHRGNFAMHGGAEGWMDALLHSGSFFVVDLSAEIALRAHALYAIPERGDRLIAATAVHLGFPLITRDPEIAAAAGVDIIW